MLPAKLFAVLAAVFSIGAGIAWLNAWPGIDIFMHDKYFVYGPWLILVFCAVASVNFAVLYYAAVRFFHARWNRTLSLLHFLLFAWFGVSLSIVYVTAVRVANEPGIAGTTVWVVVHWFTGILSLALSFGAFGLNLALILAQLVRTRFAIH